MEGGDAGSTPAGGEVVEIDAGAVGGIEEGPQVGGAEGWIEAEVGKRVEEVGEAFVAAFSGRDSDQRTAPEPRRKPAMRGALLQRSRAKV